MLPSVAFFYFFHHNFHFCIIIFLSQPDARHLAGKHSAHASWRRVWDDGNWKKLLVVAAEGVGTVGGGEAFAESLTLNLPNAIMMKTKVPVM